MSSFNKVSLFGNVGKDPEVKRFDTGKIVAKFSLATSEIHGQGDQRITETQWHNIICWKNLAELSEKYIKKGISVIIDGKIVYRSYENKEGQTVNITEIVADKIHFTGKKEVESGPTAKDEYQGGKKQSSAMSDVSELGNFPENDAPF